MPRLHTWTYNAEWTYVAKVTPLATAVTMHHAFEPIPRLTLRKGTKGFPNLNLTSPPLPNIQKVLQQYPNC